MGAYVMPRDEGYLIKEKITKLLSDSPKISSHNKKYLTRKQLNILLENDCNAYVVGLMLEELELDGFISLSKSEGNRGQVYFERMFIYTPEAIIEHTAGAIKENTYKAVKTVSNPLNIQLVFALCILMCGIGVSTNYTMQAMSLLGLDFKELTIAVAFVVSSLSILCNMYIRSAKILDKLLIFCGLIILIVTNIFCTLTVMQNNYEIDRVTIDKDVVSYQILVEERALLLADISSIVGQKASYLDSIRELRADTNAQRQIATLEWRARESEKKLVEMNKELRVITSEISELVDSEVDTDKKLSPYELVGQQFGIAPSLVVMIISIILSFIYDVFCPFLIGYILGGRREI